MLYRNGEFERIQAKYAESDGCTVVVRCRSHSLTNGHVRAIKKYTSRTIDWLAVYDGTTGQCFYIPACELADGKSTMTLRITDTRNGQQAQIRWAADYHSPDR